MRMPYRVSYTMAKEIILLYLERIYQLNKHKGTSISKVEELFDLNIELKDLVEQLCQDGHDVERLIQEKKGALEMKYLYDKLDVYIDGSARGNQDPTKEKVSGVAYSIQSEGIILHENCLSLGSKIPLPKLKNEEYGGRIERVATTNNVIEYMALIRMLEYLLTTDLTAHHIQVFSDSDVVVNQVNKTYTTRSSHLLRLRDCVWELLEEFPNVTITYIPREENDHVDWMLCQFLDNIQGIKRDRETRRRIDDESPAYRMLRPF